MLIQSVQNKYSNMKMTCPFWSNVVWKNPDGEFQSMNDEAVPFFKPRKVNHSFNEINREYICLNLKFSDLKLLYLTS